MISQAIKDFVAYLYNPNPFIKKERDSLFLNLLFPLVIICLIFAFGSNAMVQILTHFKLINPLPDFKLFDLKEKKFTLFLMVVFGGPVIEEIIFRYQLKHWYIAFLCWAILVALVLKFMFPSYPYLSVACAILVFIIPFYYRITKKGRIIFIKRFFKYHFYATAIVFGLAHITNYHHPLQYGWAVILLVFPQLFIGFLLGYIRMRFGVKNAIILHAAYNLIPALIYVAGYGN